MTDPVLFAFATLALMIAPGPTNALLATAGAMVGWTRSLPLLPAALAGYAVAIGTIHAAVTVAGPSVTWLPGALRIMAASVLVMVALGLWRKGATQAADGLPIGAKRIILTTMFNPKAMVLAVGILPIAHPGAPFYLAAFALITFGAGLAWIVLGALAGRAAPGLGQSVLARGAAVVLLGFAGGLALTV
ncbi:MAG: lysine transporter LysE [Alsobacter sp.]